MKFKAIWKACPEFVEGNSTFLSSQVLVFLSSLLNIRVLSILGGLFESIS